MIINSLFADGAAATIVSSRQVAPAPRFELQGFSSHVVPDTESLISWRIDRDHFRMGLDPSAVKALSRQPPRFRRSPPRLCGHERPCAVERMGRSSGWTSRVGQGGGCARFDGPRARGVTLCAATVWKHVVTDNSLRARQCFCGFGRCTFVRSRLTIEGMVWSNSGHR